MVTSLSGTMGDTTFRTLSPGDIVMADKAAPPRFENAADEEARDIRADEFGGVNTLVPYVYDAIAKGFPARKRNQSAANMFARHNAETLCASAPDEEGRLVRTFDFRAMALSAGQLRKPDVTATVDTESRVVNFTLTAMEEGSDEHLCAASDTVYAFVFDGEELHGRLVELGERGDGGAKAFQIPASWPVTDLYVYAFARARRGRKASDTALLYPAE